MVAPKKKRRDLDVPQFVKDQWNGGKAVRDNLAELLKQVNFDKDSTSAELYGCIVLQFTIYFSTDLPS